MIYLDSNAGAPLRPQVSEALLSLAGGHEGLPLLSNPSSIHAHGRMAKRWLAEAREAVAGALGKRTDSEEILFTSSGTEANQLAIRSVLEPRLLKGERVHWITTTVEHDSTLQMIDWARERGVEVSLLPVDSNGVPRVEALPDLWRPETALLSVMWVNNETGVISEIQRFARVAHDRGAVLHLDGAQALGKIPVDVHSTGAQLVTFSAHKIGALSGTGALWAAKGARLSPTILGKQEKGRRGGTENVLGIVAFGAAARTLDSASIEAWSTRVAALRNRLEDAICGRIPGAVVHGKGAARVANTSNLSFEGALGQGLVMALDLAGYSVSAGSACSSGTLEPSHVLLAMGRSREEAMAALRISLHDELPWEQLEGLIQALEEVVARSRRLGSSK